MWAVDGGGTGKLIIDSGVSESGVDGRGTGKL